MAKDCKRYFVKRDTQHSESRSKQLPHIFRSIPASLSGVQTVLWYVYTTTLFTCIIFFFLLQLGIFFPVPVYQNSFSDDLVDAPASYRTHLLYLESLTVKNRLEEAQHEVEYLRVAQPVLNPSVDEVDRLGELEKNITARKMVFHTTIDEYNHWDQVLQGHPDYRDVLYRLGQKSYMLFDDSHARVFVNEAVKLDPQFKQGEKVLQLLDK